MTLLLSFCYFGVFSIAYRIFFIQSYCMSKLCLEGFYMLRLGVSVPSLLVSQASHIFQQLSHAHLQAWKIMAGL